MGGYMGGVFCAIVSHPADSIVSYMNKAKGATIGSAAKALGFKGCWQGLGPRIIMIGTLTAQEEAGCATELRNRCRGKRHLHFSAPQFGQFQRRPRKRKAPATTATCILLGSKTLPMIQL